MRFGNDDGLLDLRNIRIDSTLCMRIPATLALRRNVLVFGEDEKHVYAACADPDDHLSIEIVERIVGKPAIALRAAEGDIERVLMRVFARRDEAQGDDTVRLAEEILHAAILEQASDIHIEPDRDGMRVRFRIDGRLDENRRIERDDIAGLTNRFKVMAGMDIAEHRVPQDGRFTYQVGRGSNTVTVDVRAALVPTKFGERFTFRLLGRQAETMTLEHLGMGPFELETFRKAIDASFGLVLLTGPTGSGKTTTLYAGMQTLDLGGLNVITIEDPVEYDLAGISQIEVDQDGRVGFPQALRSVLRHDPDVLMVGEIRDRETADLAIRAALTGHLVLSTLHSTSAVGAVTRLVDMGIAPYLVAAVLRLSVAQRLVRRLCTRCRVPSSIDEVAARALRLDPGNMPRSFAPRGCAFCKGTGFAGRLGLYESFVPDVDVNALIARGAQEGEIVAARQAAGARTLRTDAIEKIAAGLTTPDEALKEIEGQ